MTILSLHHATEGTATDQEGFLREILDASVSEEIQNNCLCFIFKDKCQHNILLENIKLATSEKYKNEPENKIHLDKPMLHSSNNVMERLIVNDNLSWFQIIITSVIFTF